MILLYTAYIRKNSSVLLLKNATESAQNAEVPEKAKICTVNQKKGVQELFQL